MNKNWATIAGVVAVVVVLFLLLGGTKVTCRESFWDKDKTVIEIKKD